MTVTAQVNIFASLCAVDCWIKRTIPRFKSSFARCADSRRCVAFSVCFGASEGAALWEWRRAQLLFYTVAEPWRHHRWTVPKLCEECILARFPSELSTTLSNFLFFSLSLSLKLIFPFHWKHFLLKMICLKENKTRTWFFKKSSVLRVIIYA